jgi:uncharacterized protein YbjT (DUF2867 family)
LSTTHKRILVIGATGHQGGAVVKALQHTEFTIKAFVRPHAPKTSQQTSQQTTQREKVEQLAQQGVQIAEGDLDNGPSLVQAMADVDGVFCVTTFQERGVQAEEEQGKRVVDAAKHAGIQHLIYASVGGADRKSGVPHFESKWHVEQYIRALGVPATILRPTTFMTNLQEMSAPIRFIALSMSRVSMAEKPLQMIAVQDIGKWVAHVLEHRDTYLSKAIEIAGDAVTFSQMLAAYQRVYGRTPRNMWLPSALFSRGDAGKLFTWLRTYGYAADLKANRAAIPELLTYEQFLALKQPV